MDSSCRRLADCGILDLKLWRFVEFLRGFWSLSAPFPSASAVLRRYINRLIIIIIISLPKMYSFHTLQKLPQKLKSKHSEPDYLQFFSNSPIQ